jgi:phospholipid/cholesterol/gamma-HCH transport system substrate-binding protein
MSNRARIEGESGPDSGGRRMVAGAALVVAIGLLALYLLWPSDSYRVHARFQAATQMIPGNLVMISGHEVGLVKDVTLTPDGEADLELEVDKRFAPLRSGTEATLRIASLSGSVNRYVELRIPPAGGEEIPEGGVIPSTQTTSAVDLDQLFSTFDKKTREGLGRVVRGGGRQWKGRGAEAAVGWEYLNPSLVASQRLFDELNRDTPALRRFLVANSALVTDVADRRTDVSALVDRLATATGAIAREEARLTDAISRLPGFMKRANTTYVNLRATLDDLDPLVRESTKAAPRLRAVLRELRPFAEQAGGPVRTLAATVRRDGPGNDLVELAQAVLTFNAIAVGPVQRNGAQRPGGLPQIAAAAKSQTPKMAFFRPYAVDFTGWLDDFSHSGVYDANGSASRVATSVPAFAAVGGQLQLVPQDLRDELGNAVLTRGQTNRCPGSMERPAPDKSNPWNPFPTTAAVGGCDPTQLPPGA